MNAPLSLSRATCAAHGLALGDALGYPASEHRTIRDPWVRSMLRQGPAGLDMSRVLRPVVPFVLTATGATTIVPTDDSESFAVAGKVLLSTGTEADADALFAAWLPIMGGEDVWASAAQRSAVLNAADGLLPPATGRDNPAFYDDSALPGAIAVGIAVADPGRAASLAERLASITHDAVGVAAAEATAALVSDLVSGSDLHEALDSAVERLSSDDWLADGLHDAMAIVEAASTPFSAILPLIERFAPRIYSHPGTVAETLPLALSILRATDGLHEQAMPLAMTVARHQDSLPAFVGALCGAAGSRIDGARVDRLQGVVVPETAGVSLADMAAQLVALR